MEQTKKLKNSNMPTEKEEPVREYRIAMPDTIIWF